MYYTDTTTTPARRELAQAIADQEHELALTAESACGLARYGRAANIPHLAAYLADLQKAHRLAPRLCNGLWRDRTRREPGA
jgi:hypothetical protein